MAPNLTPAEGMIPGGAISPYKKGLTQNGQAFCYYSSSVIVRATWTPLADAWDREWVMPLPSPMM